MTDELLQYEELVPPINWDPIIFIEHSIARGWGHDGDRHGYAGVEIKYANGNHFWNWYNLDDPRESEQYYAKYPDKRPTE